MAAEKEGSAPPPRPTIALPARSTYESLFRGGGFAGVSPGPMTLVSSFFAEDPDSECRSFSQLLAGAMASPAAAGRLPVSSPEPASAERDGGSGGVRPHRPLGGLVMSPSPFFTVPPGLSPASLLESPAFFSSGSGPFGISHQQALAQVTAQAVQAVQAHSHMHIQAEYPSSALAVTSLTQPANSAVNSASFQQTPPLTSDTEATTLEVTEGYSNQRTQSASLVVDKPADDGYNWRKYGQKQVKGSEYPRSYYKCTHPHCPVKKKVERSLDGQVTEIIYKGQHNHQKPPPNKRAKEGGNLSIGSSELNGDLDPANSEINSQAQVGNFNRSNEHMAAVTTSRRDQESGQATTEQLSGSSDDEEVGDAEVRTDAVDDSEPDKKRRKMDTKAIESTSSHRTVTEPRIIVQTTSEVDLLDDGYRWRKYGQKVVKGNPHPRSYYKCTSAGCNVRKHVERASTDPKAVITTYEGKHNHDVPAARNSSHSTANAGASVNVIQPKVQNLTKDPSMLNRTHFRNNGQQPVAVLQLKEEHEIT